MLTFIISLYALYLNKLKTFDFLGEVNDHLTNDLDITKETFNLLLKIISKNMIYYTEKIDTAIIIKKVLNVFCNAF
jgi:hypothetical protein